MQNSLMAIQYFDTFTLTEQNLDKFLCDLYSHYKMKGLTNIILLDSLKSISIIFMTIVYTTLAHCINYSYFDKNNDSEKNIFHTIQNINCLTIMIWIIMLCFLIYNFSRIISNARTHINIKHIYDKYLRISQRELEYIKWQKIAHKLTQLITINEYKMDELDIVSRIMRNENYLIGIANINVMQIKIFNIDIFTNINECIIRNIIFKVNWAYDGIDNIDLPSDKWENKLKHRSYIFGITSIILFPIVFVGACLYIFLRYGEQFYTDPTSIFSSKKWSVHAQWKLREFNELPHLFDTRMRQTHNKADEYIGQFPMTSTIVIIARFIMYIVGLLVLAIILVAIMTNNFTFEIYDISFMVIITVGITIIGCCRALLPPNNIISTPKKSMYELVKYTHHYPKMWRNNEHTEQVKNEFNSMYISKIQSWFSECASIFLLPYTCFVIFPRNFKNIIAFFKAYTTQYSKTGNVCVFSLLTVEKYFNKHIRPINSNVLYVPRCLRQKNKKMEKSFVNFYVNYPEWNIPEGGEYILDYLRQFVFKQESENVITSDIYTNHGLSETLLSSSIAERKSENIATEQREIFYGNIQYAFYGEHNPV